MANGTLVLVFAEECVMNATKRIVNAEIARLIEQAESLVEDAVSLARENNLPMKVSIMRTVSEGPDEDSQPEWERSDDWNSSSSC